jgi:hypothetical protein
MGQTKVDALSALIYRVSKTETFPIKKKVSPKDWKGYLTSKLNKFDWPEPDLSIDCFDNIQSRQDLYKLVSTPLLHGGFNEHMFYCTWQNIYLSLDPKVERAPVCDRRELSTIVQMGGALLELAATEFILNGRKNSYMIDVTDGTINTQTRRQR